METIERIGGYLHRIVPIMGKSGDIISYALKPFMVEFRLRCKISVIIGACIVALPICFTEMDVGTDTSN